MRLCLMMLSAVACSTTVTVFEFETGGSEGGEDTETPPHTGHSGDSSDLPEAICNPGSRWTPGQVAFADSTSAWGLDALGADGVRMSLGDVDGDGFVDVFVSKDGSDDFSEGGTRVTWLLRNTGSGFEDITESSGLRTTRQGTDPLVGRPGSVMILADVDNDGDLDVYSGLPDGADDTETSEILLNRGDGTFELGPDTAAFRADPEDIAFGAAFADVDLDGNVDLWTAHYNVSGVPLQDRLYRGDGTGHFDDITYDAGLYTQDWVYVSVLNDAQAHTNAWSALACDLNNDGAPELLAASYGRAPNHLWQNNGDGTFINRSIDSGYAFDHRVDWSDNESARCWCSLHPDEPDCDGVPSPQYIACSTDADAFRWDHDYDREPFRLGGNSGATMCGDVDNDGWVDLLTTEIVHWDVGESSDPAELLFNTGAADVTFERPGNEATGLLRDREVVDWNDGDMTGSLLDFDNDGWLDVYIGSSDYLYTRALLWHQTEARSFAEVDPTEGIDHTRAHGSLVADFDRDGDLDLVVGHGSSRCDWDCYESFNLRFFENLMGDESNFVQLKLTGTGGSNAAAIGARVEVTADGITQTRHVEGGHGVLGTQDDMVLHFGLGEACEADVTVTWPDATQTIQSFGVVSGYRFHVTQGEDPVADSSPAASKRRTGRVTAP